MSKKELCGPCIHFQEEEEFYGLGCVKKWRQLGEMFIELCGEGNCVYFMKNPSEETQKQLDSTEEEIKQA